MKGLNDVNFQDLFSAEVIVSSPSKQGNLDEYKPTPEKGKSGVYKSVIRFVPWHKSPKDSMIEKYFCFLKHPLTETGKYIDCPSSVGQPSVLNEMYWSLKKSDNIIKQKQADIFSRKKTYITLIQVIKDENNPELEGKILVWKFGKKIFDKYDSLVHPSNELGELSATPNNPYDIFNGKPLVLMITKVNDYPNYDNSKFAEQAYPLIVNGVKATNTTDKQSIIDFLVSESPDLDKYKFKPWDEATTTYVNDVINVVTGKSNSQVAAEVISQNQAQATLQSYSETVSSDLPFDDDSLMGSDNNDLGNIDDLLKNI